MRKLFLADVLHPNGGITINVKLDNDCVFCDHCSGTLWDYTNLIYMIFCDKEQDTSSHTCKYFKESNSE